MAEFDVIDAHVHLWRTQEQEKAALPLPGRRDRDRWGTPEAAVRMLDRVGISKLVFLNVLPTVEMIEARLALQADADVGCRDAVEQDIRVSMIQRIRRQNDWACETGRVYHGRLVPFIGIQPLLGEDGAAAEVRRGFHAGAKGVKIQPGMNQFHPNDRVLWPAYEEAQALGLPVLTDTGTYGAPGPDGTPYGQPTKFTEILERFPRLTLVMAHFASAYWDERVELAHRYPLLHFDISGGFGVSNLEVRDGRRALAEEDASRVLAKVGIERFLFGTDGPSVSPEPYIEQVLRLSMTDEERQLVLAGNARRLYRI